MSTVVRLLGEVDVLVNGRPVDLGTPRQRCVLAVLALEVGQVVRADRLVERVWGADATPRTRTTLHGYISRLRAALAGADGVSLTRRSGGYVLVTEPQVSTVDLFRCRELRANARADEERATALLTEAVDLWQGEALTGLTGEWAEAERERLERERLATAQDLADARLRLGLGLGEEAVDELAAHAEAHPLDERTAGQYLLALHQAGRTAEALNHYQRVRARLAEELGTDPGPALQELHCRLLTTKPDRQSPPSRSVPHELRAAPASFAGRADDVRRLDATLDAARASGTMMLAVVRGTGGLGKTWLALHWAHRRLDRFPDGQLFADLGGFGAGAPMTPAAALFGFLAALGVEPDSIPPDLHGRSALFRTLTAGKRLLVVLDNAAGTDQVVPLLPGGASCAVVVTSRNGLAGLVAAHDARSVALGVLPMADARELLAARLGAARVDAEREAVDELVGLCGGLPLALSVLAGRAGARLSALVGELREVGLDGLADDDPAASLPAVLSWSYAALTDDQATVFGLLALAPGPDTALVTAANLTGLPLARARAVLRGLEQMSLLEHDPDGRYRMHDLVRAYAAETARTLPGGVRDAAVRRVLGFCAHTAYHAGLLLDTHRGPVDLTPPEPGPYVLELSGAEAAMVWFEAERATLLAVQEAVASRDWHKTVWWLALSTDTARQRRGHRHDRLAGWRAAVDAATSLPGPAPALIARRHLGRACAALGRREESVRHLRHAVGLAGDHDDRYELGHAHQSLARTLEGHDDELALAHAIGALRLFEGLGLPVCTAHGHNAVGRHAAHLGDHDAARGHFDVALTLHRDHGNAAGEAESLDRLARLEHDAGNEAIRLHGRALTLRRGLGHVPASAETLDRLGLSHAALGRTGEAREAWQEALELYRGQGRDEERERVEHRLGGLGAARPGHTRASAVHKKGEK
ncbi:tetratricopeptide repeat protein [Amycolatopsis balhimycina DSM 5908]|uniref:Tetratricopeptide repeat protein n=1 Tax=Amycolatopsis balhimycina DSM 5908 TaxID=1081091 RepID=A0A428WSF0_AMYBA|nr:BTAD domain-containing putative transcriptional regulator [Amycolatopsis balhimycina]RSM45985.1 tetratricopeptide repeat protein [Amycolatopsis balhimycina DSM 5908]